MKLNIAVPVMVILTATDVTLDDVRQSYAYTLDPGASETEVHEAVKTETTSAILDIVGLACQETGVSADVVLNGEPTLTMSGDRTPAERDVIKFLDVKYEAA